MSNPSNLESKKSKIEVFTDGSCSGNGGKHAIGGIGIHFPNKQLKDISKVFDLGACTNQKTELYAILTALRYIKQRLGLNNYRVYIKTDSKYSIDCVTKWVYGWIKNGWKTKNNTPVINKELIELINKYYEKYDIAFIHVYAHTDNKDHDTIGNARADTLATNATQRGIIQIKKINLKNTNSTNSSNNYGKSKQNWGNNTTRNKFVVELVKSK